MRQTRGLRAKKTGVGKTVSENSPEKTPRRGCFDARPPKPNHNLDTARRDMGRIRWFGATYLSEGDGSMADVKEPTIFPAKVLQIGGLPHSLMLGWPCRPNAHRAQGQTMSSFQTTLTPNPEKLYKHYYVTKQHDTCF